jgi:hypothetical protein
MLRAKKEMLNESTIESGKDWKIILREKLGAALEFSGGELSFHLIRLFKEENV